MDQYKKQTTTQDDLVSFVTAHTDPWRDHRDANHIDEWDTCERHWRMEWSGSDKQRQSERSKLVTPLLLEAVETRLSEVNHVVFGKGTFFDIDDDMDDQETVDIEYLRKKLAERYKKDKIKSQLTQVITLGEVYGTGIGEIIVKTVEDRTPASRSTQNPGVKQIGVEKSQRVSIRLEPCHPKNFLIDPSVSEVEDSIGVGVEKFVPFYDVYQEMVSGNYKMCDIGSSGPDDDLRPVQEDVQPRTEEVRVLRYYGKVPRELLENQDREDDNPALERALASVTDDSDVGFNMREQYKDLVEAIVIIADGTHLLKAVPNPYMMKKRPVICHRPDRIPGRFWGWGTVQKGLMMQRAIDSQIRMHQDTSAITAAPMVGVDSTRMPRNFKFEVVPGKMVPVIGRSSEILEPINLGQTSPVFLETANYFDQLLRRATATLEVPTPEQAGGAGPQGMSPFHASVIKKMHRALLNIQEDLIVPFVTCSAHMYMQLEPNEFPVRDMKFVATAVIGTMAKEYENFKLMGIMQTLGPDSPLQPMLMMSVLENSNLSNRDTMIKQLQESMQPDPQQQQMEQMMQQMSMQKLHLELKKAEADLLKTTAEAQKAMAEANTIPLVAKAKYIAALSNNLDEDAESKDFQQRVKIAELALKEKDINLKKEDIESNERITAAQMSVKQEEMQLPKQIKSQFEEFNKRVDELMNSETEITRDEQGRVKGKKYKRKTTENS